SLHTGGSLREPDRGRDRNHVRRHDDRALRLASGRWSRLRRGVRVRSALGFAPHSGWAAVVVVGGDPEHPEGLARGRVGMAAPRPSGSKEPYHYVEEFPLEKAAETLARLSESAGALAYGAIGSLVQDIGKKAVAPTAAGILDSSGRKGENLAAVLASHA